MEGLLKDLVGGQGGNAGQQAQQVVSQYLQSGTVPAGTDEQVAQQVPPDVYQRAAEQAFAQLSPPQRQQFLQQARQQYGDQGLVAGQGTDPRALAQLATQIHQQQPGGLLGLFGGGQGGPSAGRGGGLGNVMSNPLAKAVLGGIAAMAVKNLLDSRGSGGQASSSGITA